jgi:chromosome segregation ATPase
MRRRQEADLGQVVAVIEDLRRHIDRDEAQIKDLSQSLGELGPGLQSARAAESASAEALRSAEKDMQNWQSRWELFNEESGETSRIADVEKARIEQIEAQMHRLLERRERRSSASWRVARSPSSRPRNARATSRRSIWNQTWRRPEKRSRAFARAKRMG